MKMKAAFFLVMTPSDVIGTKILEKSTAFIFRIPENLTGIWFIWYTVAHVVG